MMCKNGPTIGLNFELVRTLTLRNNTFLLLLNEELPSRTDVVIHISMTFIFVFVSFVFYTYQ